VPLFRYEAVDSTGAKIEAYMQVSDEHAVADRLTQMGYQPTAIELTQRSFQQTAGKTATSVGPAPPPVHGSPLTVNKRVLSRLYHQLHVSLRAGMPPFQAFTTVAAQIPEHAARQALHEMSLGVRDGARISDLMERYPRMFSRGDVGMVRAAEMAGFLPEAFSFLARQHEEDDNTTRRLRIWIWFFHSNVLTLFLMIPLAFMLKDSLPALDIRPGLISGGWSFLLGTLPLCALYYGGLAWFYKARHNPNLAYRWHRLLLRLPVIGGISKLRCQAVFSRTLQLIHHAGVTNDTAWETASGAVPNLYLAQQYCRGLSAVKATGQFSEGLKHSGLFDYADIGMIATGESAGDTEQPLEVLANRYEEETRVALGASVVRGAITFVFYAFALGGLAMALFSWAYGQGLLKLMEGIE
jgi:type II secretory pathway component PulF